MARLACALLLVPACQDAPGDLDRDVVTDLSRARGQAQGTTRSGRYFVRLIVESCDCPRTDLMWFEWATLCGPVLLHEGESLGDVDIVETDGLLLVRLPGIGALTGPIEPDGQFSVGGVIDLGTPVSHGAIVVRADGSFAEASGPPPDAPYTDWTLEASLRRRLVGEILGDPTDCTEVLEVEDVRLSP